MKIIKPFFLLLTAAAIALSLTSCSKGNNSRTLTDTSSTIEDADESSPDQTVSGPEPEVISYNSCTLRFFWQGNEACSQATLKSLRAFEKAYPGIIVEAAEGEYADLIEMSWEEFTSLSQEAPSFLDLNTLTKHLDLSSYKQKHLDLCTLSGSLYALPVSMEGRLFFWNETAFAKAGLQPPASLKELLKAGEIFRTMLGEDYYPLVLNETDRMLLLVFYLESVYGKQWMIDGVLQYGVEEITYGLDFINMLEEFHVIPSMLAEGTSNILEGTPWSHGQYAGIFVSGQDALSYQAALESGQLLVCGEPLSDLGNYQGGFAAPVSLFSISAQCPNPQEAALLLNYLVNEEGGVTLLGDTRGIPLSKKALTICTEKDLLNQLSAAANAKILDYVRFKPDSHFQNSELYAEVMNGLSYGDYHTREAAQVLLDGLN